MAQGSPSCPFSLPENERLILILLTSHAVCFQGFSGREGEGREGEGVCEMRDAAQQYLPFPPLPFLIPSLEKLFSFPPSVWIVQI